MKCSFCNRTDIIAECDKYKCQKLLCPDHLLVRTKKDWFGRDMIEECFCPNHFPIIPTELTNLEIYNPEK